MYFNRWTTFSASALLQVSCAGLTYTFAVLSPVFKDSCGQDEAHVAALGSLGFNLGGCFAIVAGLVYNALGRKNHLAPRIVIWVGIVLLSVGYLGIYAAAVGIIPPSFYTLLFFSFLAGHSGIWIDTAVMVTNVRNFPDDRGTVVGILKAFLGLCGTVYAGVYSSSFQPDAISFVLFVGIFPPIIAAVLSIFINLVPEEYHDPEVLPSHMVSQIGSVIGSVVVSRSPSVDLDRPVLDHGQGHGHVTINDTDHHAYVAHHDHHHQTEMVNVVPGVSKATRFLLVYILVAVMAMYGMVSAVWTSEYALNEGMKKALSLILLGLLSVMLLVPASVGPCTYPRRHRHANGTNGVAAEATTTTTPLLASQQHIDTLAREDSFTPPKLARDFYRSGTFRNMDSGDDSEDTLPPVDLPLLKAMLTLPFWLLFFIFACGVGTGLMYMNNLAAYVVALGGEEGDQVVFVALFSVANASGRLLVGYVSEYFLHSRGTPRTYFFSLVSFTMLVLSVAGAYASSPADLFPLTLVAGVGFGGHWSVIPAIVSDIFGIKSFASNYTFLQFAPALGGFLLATVLSSFEYSAASRAQGGDGSTCIGTDCFLGTWIYVAILNVFSFLATLWLIRGTKDVYIRMQKDKN